MSTTLETLAAPGAGIVAGGIAAFLVWPTNCNNLSLLDEDSSFENSSGQQCTNIVSTALGTPIHPNPYATASVVGLLFAIAVFLISLYVEHRS